MRNKQPRFTASILPYFSRSSVSILVTIRRHASPFFSALISSSAKQAYLKYGEGCLSAETEHSGYVPRSLRVKVEGYDLLRDEKITIRAEGYLAIVLQHEIDHFSGIMFYDRINQMAPDAKIPGAIMIE